MEHQPEALHLIISNFDSVKLGKIMHLMKIRIHFFKDMAKHTYFFVDPEYEGVIADKFMTKLKQPDSVKKVILNDLAQLLSEIKDFDSDAVTLKCTDYLKSNTSLKTEDVFFLLRFAISGNPVGAPVGDICEIIGLDATVRRI